jgi:hypothetical protein
MCHTGGGGVFRGGDAYKFYSVNVTRGDNVGHSGLDGRYYVKIDNEVVQHEDVEWIDLAEDLLLRLAVINTVIMRRWHILDQQDDN